MSEKIGACMHRLPNAVALRTPCHGGDGARRLPAELADRRRGERNATEDPDAAVLALGSLDGPRLGLHLRRRRARWSGAGQSTARAFGRTIVSSQSPRRRVEPACPARPMSGMRPQRSAQCKAVNASTGRPRSGIFVTGEERIRREHFAGRWGDWGGQRTVPAIGWKLKNSILPSTTPSICMRLRLSTCWSRSVSSSKSTAVETLTPLVRGAAHHLSEAEGLRGRVAAELQCCCVATRCQALHEPRCRPALVNRAG